MSEHLSIRISRETKERLENLAKKLGVSVSELVRNLIEIIMKVEQLQSEREMKIEIVQTFLQLLERLAHESKNIRIRITTREIVDGMTSYYYVFSCSDGECKVVLKQDDMEWYTSLREFAKTLLEDHYWDIMSVIETIKLAIY